MILKAFEALKSLSINFQKSFLKVFKTFQSLFFKNYQQISDAFKLHIKLLIQPDSSIAKCSNVYKNILKYSHGQSKDDNKAEIYLPEE